MTFYTAYINVTIYITSWSFENTQKKGGVFGPTNTGDESSFNVSVNTVDFTLYVYYIHSEPIAVTHLDKQCETVLGEWKRPF